MHINYTYLNKLCSLVWNFFLLQLLFDHKLSLLSSAISLVLLKAKEQWHSQNQFLGRVELGLLTALLEYMTVLLEYLDLSISVAGHSKDLEGPGLPLATPLKKKHGV